jgi:uncharacterized membrane protein
MLEGVKAAVSGGDGTTRLARGLGVLSAVLGAPLVIAPGTVGRLIGVGGGRLARLVLRLVGVRELVSAAGLLSRPERRAWLWSRVGGDSMDLVLLSAAMARGGSAGRIGATMGAVGGIAAADAVAANRLGGRGRASARKAVREAAEHTVGLAHRAGHTAHASITVARPRGEVYRFWRDFQNLPRFMQHLERVVSYGALSHWEAKAPFGRSIEWDAELVEDRPDERIVWRTVVGSNVDASGSVRFTDAPGDRGTEVTVELNYVAPAGALGRTVAKVFGEEPEQQVRDDLRRFKQVLETGEVVRSDGSPEGVDAGRQLRQRPAEPPLAA